MRNRTQLNTVMYVDDEPHIREIVEMSLSLTGTLTVHIAGGGAEALELLKRVRPDLILLDAMMPEMDGPSTLACLRRDPALKHIPVAFMTAKAMPQEVERFIQMGAIGVIPKPFDPMQLEEQVFTLWESTDEQ